jgi:hypothetical protein
VHLTYEQMEEFIAYLNGTCMDMMSAFENFFEFDMSELDAQEEITLCGKLDDRIFNCERCGWWYDMGDLADNNDAMICSSCEEE